VADGGSDDAGVSGSGGTAPRLISLIELDQPGGHVCDARISTPQGPSNPAARMARMKDRVPRRGRGGRRPAVQEILMVNSKI